MIWLYLTLGFVGTIGMVIIHAKIGHFPFLVRDIPLILITIILWPAAVIYFCVEYIDTPKWWTKFINKRIL